jgi:anti-sigma factor RsiW
MNKRIEDWALNAYADGELDASDRAGVEKLLSDDLETRQAMDIIRRQNAALHAAFDGVLDEPVPADILATINNERPWRLPPYAAIAASLLLIVAGGLGGWFFAHETRTPQSFDLAQVALVAHEVYSVDLKHPVEIAASDKDQLQTWLSRRIGVKVKIPDMTADGYQFMGGRLLAASTEPAGQLMYEAADKGRLTIFFGTNPSGKEEGLRVLHKGKLISCYWQERDFAFAVTGDMPLDDMMRIAKDVYEQVEDDA